MSVLSTDIILHMRLKSVHRKHLGVITLLKCRVCYLGPDLDLKYCISNKLPGNAIVASFGVTS